ncbi:MAG: flagellin, partial [Candidatus Aenigmatarchaeota archaeon]
VITVKPKSDSNFLFHINARDVGEMSVGKTNYMIYVTTDPQSSAQIEGTYVAEVGQFEGPNDSQLDVRLVEAHRNGVTVLSTVGLSRGYDYQNNILFLWNGNAFTINDFGGSLPTEAIVDSGVARAEGVNLDNNQLTFQIGANEGHNMLAGIDSMLAKDLGITEESLDVTTQGSAKRAVMIIDGAIHRVSAARAALGAIQNRLEHTIANLGVAAENLTAAESRIRDADMAKEMMEFTKQQILLQSSMAMLAQANVMPQNVLQLMR